jgi:hypothetical protein
VLAAPPSPFLPCSALQRQLLDALQAIRGVLAELGQRIAEQGLEAEVGMGWGRVIRDSLAETTACPGAVVLPRGWLLPSLPSLGRPHTCAGGWWSLSPRGSQPCLD